MQYNTVGGDCKCIQLLTKSRQKIWPLSRIKMLSDQVVCGISLELCLLCAVACVLLLAVFNNQDLLYVVVA